MNREALKNELTNADFSSVQSETLSHIVADLSTKDDLRELRTSMHGEFRAVRSEMASEFRAVRSEMTSEFRAVRSEMASEFGAVRGEMKVMESNLAKAIAESSAEIMKTMVAFQNKLFMLTLGLIGALATIVTMLELLID